MTIHNNTDPDAQRLAAQQDAPGHAPQQQSVSGQKASAFTYLSDRYRRLTQPGLSLRQRIRLIPGLGYAAACCIALLRLPAIRHADAVALANLQQQADSFRQQADSFRQQIDSLRHAERLHQQRIAQLESARLAIRLERYDALDIGARLMQLDRLQIARQLKSANLMLGSDLQRKDALSARIQKLEQAHALIDEKIPAPPTPQADPLPSWQIEGPFDSSYSLALVNRELARALSRQSGQQYRITLRSREGHGAFPPSEQFLAANPDVAAMVAARRAQCAPDVVLRNCYPPNLDDMQGRVRLVHTYGWEETGFPAQHVDEFNRKLDLITVMSRFVGKVLRDNGVRVPIAVVGIGVDHILQVEPQHPAPDLLATWRGFRFLHVSSCFPRKGVDALLAAYGRAFRRTDDVTLLIKTFPNQHNDVEQQLNAWQQKDVDYPHVQIILDDYSPAQLRGLYQACDALVAPSRGEGFCLPVAEAMLLKLPVITTAWSGQMDFCDDSTTWLCDYRFAKSGSHFGPTHSAWADPDVAHLAALLTQVHSSTEQEKQARTHAAHQRIADNFSWSDVALRTSAAIHAVQRQPLLRKEPRIGWLSTWNARCGVASYSAFLTSEIPDGRLAILASHTAERTVKDGVNVFRCWDAGMDETLDHAFETIIEQGLGAVVVQYNFGFFTLPVLARLIHRLKQAGIAVHVFFHSTADLVRADATISLGAIADALALAERLYVHGIDDLNRMKRFGLIDNVVFFPQGLMPTLAVVMPEPKPEPDQQEFTTVIAAYGFLLPNKGIQPLIHAFASLAEQDVGMHLLLVNSLYPIPESEHELHACQWLVRHLGLTGRVTFHSEYLADEESQARLQRADLIVYPYQQTQESSSAAVRMGLAAGRPVAVTPLAIFDDVADAVHILPGADPQSLAEGIAALLKDEARLAKKSEQALAWSASRQWPALSLRLLNLIDGIANTLDTDSGRI